MRASWTPELDELLTLMHDGMTSREFAAFVGCSRVCVDGHGKALGLRKSVHWIAEASRRATLARSPYSPEIREVIELMYPDMLSQTIADFVGVPLECVYRIANRLGLKKSAEVVRETARARSTADHPMAAFRFKKDQVPPNKGVKGWDSGGRSHLTRFKKGSRPPTWKPLGSERTADGYVQVKVTDTGYPPRDWVGKHIVVWETTNGRKVPPSHAVRFKDGNRKNFAPENLELLTRAELMRRNSVHTVFPPEVVRLVQLRGALNRQINRRTRAIEEGKS